MAEHTAHPPTGNVMTGNDTHVFDEGTGNCGSGITPELFDPCV
jgi:hypothetical protein